MPGAFRVYRDKDNPKDIYFEVQAKEIPPEQLELRDQVGSALSILRIIISDKDRFEEYFRELLSLAQAGLVGETANPDLAVRALREFKLGVTSREAGRIKNQYMKTLGFRAAILVTVLIVALATVFFFLKQASPFLLNLIRFEIGTMIGVWLSFGTRKPVLNFEDLHVLEEDRMEPLVRLVFAGLLALIVALAFHLKVVTLTLGTLTTDQLDSQPWAAFFFGLLSGVGEKALSTNVTRQASTLLKA
jgi:hypothetical protein